MDEGVFIVIALVIILGLIAGLYFVIDLLSQRVLSLAGQACAREQNEIINHQRLARTLNELVDETTVLADALKNERILRSHTEAAGRVAAKKAACADLSGLQPAAPARDDRKVEETWPPVHAEAGRAESFSDDDATCVLVKPEIPVTPGKTTARLTPTRVSIGIYTPGGQP